MQYVEYNLPGGGVRGGEGEGEGEGDGGVGEGRRKERQLKNVFSSEKSIKNIKMKSKQIKNDIIMWVWFFARALNIYN